MSQEANIISTLKSWSLFKVSTTSHKEKIILSHSFIAGKRHKFIGSQYFGVRVTRLFAEVLKRDLQSLGCLWKLVNIRGFLSTDCEPCIWQMHSESQSEAAWGLERILPGAPSSASEVIKSYFPVFKLDFIF